MEGLPVSAHPSQARRWTLPQMLMMLAAGIGAFVSSARFLAPDSLDGVVEVVRPERQRAAYTPTAAVVEVPGPSQASVGEEARLKPESAHNPFGPLNLKPPAPVALGAPEVQKPPPTKPQKPAVQETAPVVAVPPPAPTAPALPFVAIGTIEGHGVTEGQPLAFLQQQDRLLVVRKGESIGSVYRVESITPERIEFTYLPLQQRQALRIAP